jgi:L-cysteine desulfidase
MISFNYAGQLKIKYTTPDHIEKTVLISVDTSETILTLKTKIYNKEGIDPSYQHLMIKKPYSTIVHLENDRTIASYKIQNNSELALSIQS